MAGHPESAVVDLRSDLISRPTPEMVQAMVAAAADRPAFGLREDARQQALEARAAAILGKEDALFFPTCTMCNQTAIHVFCTPGESVLAESQSHIITSEAGAPATLSGVTVRPLPGTAGRIDLAALDAALGAPVDEQRSRAALIVLENTHNRAGGTILSPEYHARVAALAGAVGVPIHLDGARLFNAVVASERPAGDFTRHVTSVAVNVNKALGAPVGALLAGSRDFIREAARVRVMLGGGIRPTAILAAAALVALETAVERLADDHRRAKRLAHGLAGLPGLAVDLASVQTNIVVVSIDRSVGDANAVVGALAQRRVLALPFGAGKVRLVLYRDIGESAVEAALAAFREVVAGGTGARSRPAGRTPQEDLA